MWSKVTKDNHLIQFVPNFPKHHPDKPAILKYMYEEQQINVNNIILQNMVPFLLPDFRKERLTNNFFKALRLN